jgi:hypothetical protein
MRKGSLKAVAPRRSGASGAHAVDRDHRDGPQTAHRNLAVRHVGAVPEGAILSA